MEKALSVPGDGQSRPKAGEDNKFAGGFTVFQIFSGASRASSCVVTCPDSTISASSNYLIYLKFLDGVFL